jgi:TRAP-type C4-dicarboxylate transport system substrate-binding protein
MSLKAWNGLTRKQQDLIKQVALEIEQEQETYFAEREATARKKMIDSGVKFIKFSQNDAAWYLDKAYGSKWAELQKKLDADSYTKIRQLLKAK